RVPAGYDILMLPRWMGELPRHPRGQRRGGGKPWWRGMIEARDLYKSFGGVRAVQGVSFIARDGEITGIIGPNGAGKTTILRMIYTVLSPDSGKTLVDGIDAARDRRAAQRRLGVMPDVRGLYPRLSAREHVRYFGELHGLEAHEIERR